MDVIIGERGPLSDINVLNKQRENFKDNQYFQGDKADQGAERTSTPKKKPIKKEMPEEIKEKNQQKAQKRIFVEHVIRLLKIFGIARERFRLKEKSYEKVVMVVCGLVKLRIGALILV